MKTRTKMSSYQINPTALKYRGMSRLYFEEAMNILAQNERLVLLLMG